MWDGCPALEYRILAAAVIVFGFWLDSVGDRTLECGCLVKLLWFFSMLGVILYTGWFGIVWTRWAWGL